MLIHLVRHGRSAHVHDGSYFHWHHVSRYEDAYDAASIRDDERPSVELERLIGEAPVVAASDLLRAIASAQRLAPGREIAISPLLREIRLEPPRWIPFRLPIDVWDALSHIQWSYRLTFGADNEFMRRASMAVEWLEEHAARSSTVVAVTHGGFRRLLDARLVARGWRRSSALRSYANWSVWSYVMTY